MRPILKGTILSSVYILFSALIVLGLIGFTNSLSAQTDDEEETKATEPKIKPLKKNQGYVIGSFLITVPSTGEKSWRFGPKMTKMKWSFEITKDKGFDFGRSITVEPNKEMHFVKRLKAGDYRFKGMSASGPSGLYFPLDMPFTVIPGKNYIFWEARGQSSL